MKFTPVNPRTKIQFADCNDQDFAKFPDLKIVVGDKMYTVPRQSYVFHYKAGKLDKCYLLLTPRDYMGDSFVLGNIFLNNYYAIYDL